MATCEQLCSSCSSEKALKVIAGSSIATYLTVAIAAIASIINFVLSVTQSQASDGMHSACRDNEIIEFISPISVTGTISGGTTCFGYCPWPRNNQNLRFTANPLFIALMVLMMVAINKKRCVWFIRFSFFITLTLMFAALVQDCHSLIAGKKVCENGFKVHQNGQENVMLNMQCDDETVEIETCNLEPYIFMIFSDIFAVMMCAVLWQLIAYLKQMKAEVDDTENMLSQDLEQAQIEPIPHENEGGNGQNANVSPGATTQPSAFSQIEDY